MADSGDEWCASDNFQDKDDDDSLTEFELEDDDSDEESQISDCSSSSQLLVFIAVNCDYKFDKLIFTF